MIQKEQGAGKDLAPCFKKISLNRLKGMPIK